MNASRSEIVMGTVVSMNVLRSGGDAQAALDRAFLWFHELEGRTSRFESSSELRQLSERIGVAVPVSPTLFESVRFALMVAEETEGAFDPTIGRQMELRGFNRDYRTGERVDSGIAIGRDVSYRDVELDPDRRTIALRRPLLLDLSSVAKGLAVDLAARELRPFRDFAIDAGGDLYLGGVNEAGAPWRVGIRHPREDSELLGYILASDQAVCTSGDYERRSAADSAEHHIVDPAAGRSPEGAASVTVVASEAMLADALATAAFVLGPEKGIDLLHRYELDGLIVTPDLRQYQTRDLLHAA